MKFDVTVFANDLNAAGQLGAAVEESGFDGLWVAEAAHNPFLPLAHAALATGRINLGTAIAVAFPRDPLLLARTAWDLAQASDGRFILGLGTQIKPHITKRFSSHWGKPLPQLREYIAALRAIWDAYAGGDTLDLAGDYYGYRSLTVPSMPTIGEIGEIPIYIAGVNTGLARLAGEICDGFHVHSFPYAALFARDAAAGFRQRPRQIPTRCQAAIVMRRLRRHWHGRRRNGSEQAPDQIADRLLRQPRQATAPCSSCMAGRI